MHTDHSTDNTLHFAALLIVNKYNRDSPNISTKLAKYHTYLNCANNLARSLYKFGYKLNLYTNDVIYVQNNIHPSFLDIAAIKYMSADLEVPPGVAFSSAHHKIDLLEVLGKCHRDSHIALVDLDTEMLRPLPPIDKISHGIFAYDISDQLLFEFKERVHIDMNDIAETNLISHRWYGGEFLLGKGSHFKAIADLSKSYMPRYNAIWPTLIHQGDEIIVSTAINELKSKGLITVHNAYPSMIFRYWSNRTNAPMTPLINSIKNVSIIHIPADKDFLSDRSWKSNRRPFLIDYLTRKFLGITIRFIANPFLNLLKREAKFPPRIF